jgi:hypothetical protein
VVNVNEKFIELQRKYLTIPIEEQYIIYRGFQSNFTSDNIVASKTLSVDCIAPKTESQIPEDFLKNYSPQLEPEDHIQIRIITNDQRPEDFLLSDILIKKRTSNKLNIITVTPDVYQKELNEVEDEFQKVMDSMSAFNPNLTIGSFISEKNERKELDTIDNLKRKDSVLRTSVSSNTEVLSQEELVQLHELLSEVTGQNELDTKSNIRRKEFIQSKPVFPSEEALSPEEIDLFLHTNDKFSENLGQHELDIKENKELEDSVKSLLLSPKIIEKSVFNTYNLDTPYIRTSPKNWPKDKEIPFSVIQILGKEYTRGIIERGIEYYSEDDLTQTLDYARAWRVPSIEQKLLFFENYASIHDCLESFIHNATGLPFVLQKGGVYGGLGAFRHLHTNAALAMREEIPNILHLEIYGILLAARGYDFTNPEFESYLTEKESREGKLFKPEGPLVVKILTATASNFSYPGIGIPEYE